MRHRSIVGLLLMLGGALVSVDTVFEYLSIQKPTYHTYRAGQIFTLNVGQHAHTRSLSQSKYTPMYDTRHVLDVLLSNDCPCSLRSVSCQELHTTETKRSGRVARNRSFEESVRIQHYHPFHHRTQHHCLGSDAKFVRTALRNSTFHNPVLHLRNRVCQLHDGICAACLGQLLSSSIEQTYCMRAGPKGICEGEPTASQREYRHWRKNARAVPSCRDEKCTSRAETCERSWAPIFWPARVYCDGSVG